MAGPQDIQRPATSLLDLLGLKSTGDSPHLLSNEIAGNLELLDLYLLNRRTTTQNIAGSTITAAGWKPISALTPSILSPGTVYYVYSAEVYIETAAASSWNGFLGVERKSFVALQGYSFLAGNPIAQLGASTGVVLGRYFERPYLLGPGDTIGIFTHRVTGNTIVPALFLDYCEVAA